MAQRDHKKLDDGLLWTPKLKRREEESDWSWVDRTLAWAAIGWVALLVFFIL